MRRLFAVFAALGLLLLFTARAGAQSGAASDPAGDDGNLDITAVSHSDTSSQVTFRATFASTPSRTTNQALKWFFGNDKNSLDTACGILTYDASTGDQFALYSGGCDASTLGPRIDQGNGSRPVSDAIEWTTAISSLSNAGLHTGNGTQLYYRVKSYCGSAPATTTTTRATTTSSSTSSTSTSSTTTSSTTTSTSTTTTSTTTPPTTTPPASCATGANAPAADTAPDNGKDPVAFVNPGVPASGGGGGGGGGGTGGATTTTLAGGVTQNAATVSKSVVDAGDTLVMSGDGFAGNVVLTEQIQSDPVILGTTTSDANGRYSVTIRIPANTLPGTHTLTVFGPDATAHRHESVATITVRLPRTGAANTTRTAATGAAVLALGLAVLSLAYYERQLVSVGASKATAAITSALKHFDI